jgi:hypothetical protein
MRHLATTAGRAVSGLSIALALLALLAARPGNAAARDSQTASPAGYDISYPRCGGGFPANPVFGIVGVNAGIVYSPNPCLGTGDGPSELTWAGGPSAQLYANTANPGPALSTHWPNGQTSPRTCNTPTVPGADTADCAYDYGWNAAANSYQAAVQAYVALGLAPQGATRTPASNTWWLDVETANSWRSDLSLNVADLQGAVAYLQSVGAASVGFYSTAYQWTQITGGTLVFAAAPAWVAGAASLLQATSTCQASGFTGGSVALAQYPAQGFDADLDCAPVPPPTPDFSLSVSPSSQSVVQGGATGYTVTITRTGGFSGPVSLSVGGQPSGTGITFNPNPATASSASLTVTTTASTPAGTSALTITGTSGSLTRTAGASLIVTVAPTPDFRLSVSPSSQTVAQGASASYTVTITRSGGFSGSVSLSLGGLPSGARITFSPNPAAGASSTLTLSTSAGTPRGSYALTLMGTNGSLTRTAGATLVVQRHH